MTFCCCSTVVYVAKFYSYGVFINRSLVYCPVAPVGDFNYGNGLSCVFEPIFIHYVPPRFIYFEKSWINGFSFYVIVERFRGTLANYVLDNNRIGPIFFDFGTFHVLEALSFTSHGVTCVTWEDVGIVTVGTGYYSESWMYGGQVRSLQWA